jgi:amino acid adenylation domain-containing protein
MDAFMAWHRNHRLPIDGSTSPFEGGGASEGSEAAWMGLPADFIRSGDVLRVASEQVRIGESVTTALGALGERAGVVTPVVLLTALQALLRRYDAQPSQTIGVIVEDERGELGALLWRADLSRPPSFEQLLAQSALQLLASPLTSQAALARAPIWFGCGESSGDRGERLLLSALTRANPGIAPRLLLRASSAGGALVLTAEYDASRFAPTSISAFLDCYLRLLEGALGSPALPVSALPIMGYEERVELEAAWRRLRPYPEHVTVHRMFERRVEEAPDALALVSEHEGQRVSYRQLNRMANATATRLRALGVAPGEPVGVCMQRSLDMVVSLLAILKAGAAYVTFDPDSPLERLRFQIEDSGARVVLSHDRVGMDGLLEDVQVLAPHRSSTDAPGDGPVADHDDDLDVEVSPDDMAYLCYTSGTTGRPKAAMIPHRGIIRLLFGIDYVDLGPEETGLHAMAPAFDASTFALWAPLLHGSCCVLYPPETPTPEGIGAHIRRHGVKTMVLTTAMFNAIVDDNPLHLSGLRQLLVGGEALSVAHVRRAMAALPETTLSNLYGPTEVTTAACAHRIAEDPGERASIPIGTAIGNTWAYVLDEHLRPVPVGVPGELYLAGAGVALGYWRRPELSEQVFVADPFAGRPGARMYKTGDRVRRLPSGAIEGTIDFLGRVDSQVKLRGHRIELREIQAVLRELPGIQDAFVSVAQNRVGERVLIAHVVTEREAELAELRALLAAKLPEYMIPSRLIPLEQLPMTANGKIDLRALPEPDWSGASERHVAPRTATEQAVAAIWSEVLGVERVGVHDSFAELGGHSLLATQVLVRLREEHGADLPNTLVFEASTVAEQARALDGFRYAESARPTPVLGPRPRGDEAPLSFSQERVWFIEEMRIEASAYNFQAIMRFSGDLKVDVLRRALDEIVRRHEIFRTVYLSREGKPYMKIHPPLPAAFSVEDLSYLDEAERERALAARLHQELQTPFDLTRLPLIRWQLMRLRNDEHALIQVEHHMVHDGWSYHVFLSELMALYRAYASGQPSPLEPLPIQFADFAVWQREWVAGDHAADHLAYWRENLRGLPPVWNLPLDRPRPRKQTMRGASERIELPAALADAARELARRLGASLYQVMFSAYLVLIHRYTEQDDLCIGTGVANRTQRAVEKLIGMVINTIALRTNLSGDPRFHELIDRVKEVTRRGYANQDIPFDKVVDALGVKRSLAYSPIYQSAFSFHDAPMPNLDLPGVEFRLREGLSNGSAKFELSVISMPRAEQNVRRTDGADDRSITMVWEYSTDILDGATVRRMIEHYRRILTAVCADPSQRISRVPLLGAEEREDLLVRRNQKAAALPTDQLIHQLVASRAAASPDARALRHADRVLSYGELVERAHQVAHLLLARSIGKGDLVAVCMDHSIERAVALLGILEAGAAFVALDPKSPHKRTADMLVDCGARLLFTRSEERDRVPDSLDQGRCEVVCLDPSWRVLTGLAQDDPGVAVAPEDLAYVIYTSGSTGRPKGVMVEHRNLLNLTHWHRAAFAVSSADRIAQLAGTGFDASIWELFPNLAAGAELVVMPPAIRAVPEGMRNWLIDNFITLTFAPTPVAERLIALGWPASTVLRLMLTGGAHLHSHPERPLPFALYNNYGPTEYTVVTTSGLVPARSDARRAPTIGRPVANTWVYVLDEHLQPVPEGVPGELFISGAGLARGYLGQPELTAERFLTDPFSDDPRGRMYRSGDRVRYVAGGELEFLGRSDDQVQIRGARVEPGEVSSALCRHPDVLDAFTLPREDRTLGVYLVSYVAAERDLSSAELRDFLKASLPAHMVPTTVVCLTEMPMTPNGKVDVERLPAVGDVGSLADRPFQPPRTETEEGVARIWREILGREEMSVHDDFFELGGHSLVAAQVIARARKHFAVELPLQVLFDAPTIESFAALVDQSRASSERIAPITHEDSALDLLRRVDQLSDEQVTQTLAELTVYRHGSTARRERLIEVLRALASEPREAPVSYSQRRLWRILSGSKGGSFHNIARVLHIRGALDRDALERSLNTMVERHEMLRTVFVTREGQPIQRILPSARVTIEELDASASADSSEERRTRARALVREQSKQPFDLERGPLFRVLLIDLGPGEQMLALIMLHIIVDGWSMKVLARELSALYGAFARGQPSQLPPLPIQYADFAAWQRRELDDDALAGSLQYWREQLQGAPQSLDLPISGQRPAEPDDRGAIHVAEISAELVCRVQQLASSEGATPYMAFLAAFNALLGHVSGQEDILFISTHAGRTRPELEQMIGFFVNPLAMRTDLRGAPSFRALLRRVRATVLAARRNQDAPLDMVLEQVCQNASAGRRPNFQVLFDYQESIPTPEPWPGLDVGAWEMIDKGTAVIDLAVGLEAQDDGRVKSMFQYPTQLFSETAIASMNEQFGRLLEAVVADPDRPVGELARLTFKREHA